MTEEFVSVECVFLRETYNAVLVTLVESDEDVWFPLSQVRAMERNTSDEGSITVTKWIARQKGIL